MLLQHRFLRKIGKETQKKDNFGLDSWIQKYWETFRNRCHLLSVYYKPGSVHTYLISKQFHETGTQRGYTDPKSYGL